MRRIKEIARRLRRKLERLSSEDCSCMCAIGSSALTILLKKHRINARLVYGQFRMAMGTSQIIYWADHCWVETQTHLIDITATQFGRYHKVLVLSKKDERYSRLYKECRRSKPRPDPSASFWRRWPKEQCPTINLIDRLCG